MSVEFEQNIARADYIKHLYDLFYNFSGEAGLRESIIFAEVALGIDFIKVSNL